VSRDFGVRSKEETLDFQIGDSLNDTRRRVNRRRNGNAPERCALLGEFAGRRADILLFHWESRLVGCDLHDSFAGMPAVSSVVAGDPRESVAATD
jgi:hypothetical protein